MLKNPFDLKTDDRPEVQTLLANIKASLPALEKILKECSEFYYEDGVYRFYHQSFKALFLQERTQQMVEALRALLPGRELNPWFCQIIQEGTEKRFKLEDNQNWLQVTRPIIEAFFHAKYFLEMVIRYGKTLDDPPNFLPSGWAAVLYLYGLR